MNGNNKMLVIRNRAKCGEKKNKNKSQVFEHHTGKSVESIVALERVCAVLFFFSFCTMRKQIQIVSMFTSLKIHANKAFVCKTTK